MDIAQLRCFLAVADKLHFGRAAVKLHLSPSPVSRAVGRLEAELGVELFIRDHRNVTLTAAGRALQSEGGEILGRFDSLGSVARAAGEDKQRTVVLGGTHMAPPEVLDRVVDLVRKANGDVKVKVVVADSAELLSRIVRGGVDIALVHVPVDSPGIEHRVLATYHLAVAMRSDDPLAEGTHVAWSDVRQRGLMVSSSTGSPNAMTVIRAHLEECGIERFDLVSERKPRP
jgi:DNA-binding transcriptional LysR family regulator